MCVCGGFTRYNSLYVLFEYVKRTIKRTFHSMSARSVYYSISHLSFNCVYRRFFLVIFFSLFWRYGRTTCGFYRNSPSKGASATRMEGRKLIRWKWSRKLLLSVFLLTTDKGRNICAVQWTHRETHRNIVVD